MAQCEKQKNKSHCLTVDPRGVSHDHLSLTFISLM